MDCSHFEEVFHDLDRPGTSGFAARDAALMHAESCGRCAQLLTHSELLDAAFHALSSKASSEQAPPTVEALLLKEFRQRKVVIARRGVRWQFAALGTAAALFLAVALSLHYRAEKLKSATGTTNVSKQEGSAGNSSMPSKTSLVPEESVAENEATNAESATEFVALPYADGSADDGGAIVRVMLSRPALASLGLPVTDMGAADQVPADIVVSEDGAPQAIRLVSQTDLD